MMLKFHAASRSESSICRAKNIWIRLLFPRQATGNALAVRFKKTAMPVLVLMALFACQRTSPRQSSAPAGFLTDAKQAVEQAHEQNKPVLMFFTAKWCPSCRQLKDSTLTDAAVISRLSAFIPVSIDIDEQKETTLEYNADARKFGGVGIPNMWFLSPGGERLRHVIGYKTPQELSAVMDSILNVIR
ncbi:thioredoxin family protein [bacterium]|nr:thioredoxin family protein [bacterium]